METEPIQPPTIKSSVLSRIACEQICPRARMWFRCREGLWWLGWITTIAAAAVAVAVSFFVVSHRAYSLYEVTHDTFLGFMIDVLPWLWVGIFLVSALGAYVYVRNTKRGYRYSLWLIVGVSVSVSVVCGLALHWWGMSLAFDRLAGYYMPGWYHSQDQLEERFWQQPAAGRLLVRVLVNAESEGVITVVDVEGATWELNTSELFAEDIALLRSGQQVRVLGFVQPTTLVYHLRACGVFPWRYEHMVSMKQHRHDRAEAVYRLRAHRDAQNVPGRKPSDTSSSSDRLCAQLPPLQRLPEH